MEGAKDSELGLSLQPLPAALDRSGASLSLTSLVSLWGGYSTNRPRRSLGCRSLFGLGFHFFFPLFFKKSDSCIVFPPGRPSQDPVFPGDP